MKQVLRFVFQAGVALTMMAGLLALPFQAVQAAAPINLVVKSVVFDSRVTIVATNLPVDTTFKVMMGASGALQGADGSVVANFDTTTVNPFIYTFEIPTSMVGVEKVDLRIEASDGSANAFVTFVNHSTNVVSNSGIGGVPTLAVVSVLSDSAVTVQAGNLPADTDFTVRMGESGTQGLGGSVAAGFNSGAGGMVVHTFDIPASLIGLPVIDIRIDALGGYYASTSFNNPPGSSAAPVGVGGASSLFVNSVIGNSMLTFIANNLPANTVFTVRIGAAGSQGNGGNVVANFETVDGGTFNHLVEIPTNLYGSEKLDLRIEAAGGYAIYTTFNNMTTP